MTALWLFSLAVLFAMADWYAVEKNISWLRYSSKPLVIILLGIWLLFQPIGFIHPALVFPGFGFFTDRGYLVAGPFAFLHGRSGFFPAGACLLHHRVQPSSAATSYLVGDPARFILHFSGGIYLPTSVQKYQKEIRYTKAAGCDLDLLHHPVLDGIQCSIHPVPTGVGTSNGSLCGCRWSAILLLGFHAGFRSFYPPGKTWSSGCSHYLPPWSVWVDPGCGLAFADQISPDLTIQFPFVTGKPVTV